MASSSLFEQRMQRVDALVEQIERSRDFATQSAAREVVGLLLDLHRAGLSRLLEIAEAEGAPDALRQAWSNDDLVRSLLVLHDVHPESVETRVRAALDGLRSALKQHAARAELVNLDEGLVRIRIFGDGTPCGSSRGAIRELIEGVVGAAAPDARIEIEGLEAAPSFPLVQLSLESH